MRCGALLAAQTVRGIRSNSQQNLARGRFCSSSVAIHRTPPPEGGGGNDIDVVVAGQRIEPKYRWLSSLLWNKLWKL
jgi:hypothetical protein